MRSKPYEPLITEGEWDCEEFETCPLKEMLCHKCPYSKLSDLRNLMKEQKFITMNVLNQYSILPIILQSQSQKLVTKIMNILFEDEDEEQ